MGWGEILEAWGRRKPVRGLKNTFTFTCTCFLQQQLPAPAAWMPRCWGPIHQLVMCMAGDQEIQAIPGMTCGLKFHHSTGSTATQRGKHSCAVLHGNHTLRKWKPCMSLTSMRVLHAALVTELHTCNWTSVAVAHSCQKSPPGNNFGFA